MVKKALLLGMVYSVEKNPKRGQTFRDRVRCEALESLGYEVHTLDNKHDSNKANVGRHCRANFSQCSRLFRDMENAWSSNCTFSLIVLDYFFAPQGYVQTRWTEPFFRDTLPSFVTNNSLSSKGKLILPHMRYVDEMITKYSSILKKHYEWHLSSTPNENPLYSATDIANSELIRCPDNMTNSSQFKYLLEYPFYIFQPKLVETETTSNIKKEWTHPVSSSSTKLHNVEHSSVYIIDSSASAISELPVVTVAHRTRSHTSNMVPQPQPQLSCSAEDKKKKGIKISTATKSSTSSTPSVFFTSLSKHRNIDEKSSKLIKKRTNERVTDGVNSDENKEVTTKRRKKST